MSRYYRVAFTDFANAQDIIVISSGNTKRSAEQNALRKLRLRQRDTKHLVRTDIDFVPDAEARAAIEAKTDVTIDPPSAFAVPLEESKPAPCSACGGLKMSTDIFGEEAARARVAACLFCNGAEVRPAEQLSPITKECDFCKARIGDPCVAVSGRFWKRPKGTPMDSFHLARRRAVGWS